MRLIAIVAVVFGITFYANGADDPASVLARILMEKGTISSSDLARVESAGSSDKATVLASILSDKGLLSSNDVARVKGLGGAERAATEAKPTPPMPAPKAPTPPKV